MAKGRPIGHGVCQTDARGESLRTVIVGAGAVGLGLGSCLHGPGRSVHFLVRGGTTPHPLEAHDLRRTGLFGEVCIPAGTLEVSRSAQDLRGLEIDFVLVCTKSTASVQVAETLAGIWRDLPAPPAVVLCQNGWGNAEIFAERIPGEHVYSARVITGFRRGRDCEVEVTVHADAIRVGSLFGGDVNRLRALCQAVTSGGIPCELARDIGRDLWAKVLYNCLLNPLGALVGVPYGVLGERSQTRAVMEATAREVFSVLEPAGHATHWASADEYLETFYRDLLPATALHESSMLLDLRAGRATEIDSLCGAVVRLGREHGVPTPINAALARLVLAARRSR